MREKEDEVEWNAKREAFGRTGCHSKVREMGNGGRKGRRRLLLYRAS